MEGGMDPFNGKDVRGVAKGLKAGQEYDLEIRVSNAALASVALPFHCWGCHPRRRDTRCRRRQGYPRSRSPC